MNPHKISRLNGTNLSYIAFGPNGAGGGGNVLELFNPGKEKGIVGLVEEIGDGSIRLVRAKELPAGSTVACMARLGKPGARADSYANEAAQAMVGGLQQLSEHLSLPIPSAIFPVEATAGQMARAIRAARASSQALGHEMAIVDGDLCGGLAVPAVPLAYNVATSLHNHPDIALIELKEKDGQIKPSIQIIKQTDSFAVEAELRQRAADSEMGAVWFAWLLSPASSFNNLFTDGAVSNSVERGEVVYKAVQEKKDPAMALVETYPQHAKIVFRGTVEAKKEYDAKAVGGFYQASYIIKDTSGQKLGMTARNEYIVLHAEKEIVARAPHILIVLDQNGPIQSHVLTADTERVISVVEMAPQSMINHPDRAVEWQAVWDKYFDAEKKAGRWNYPY